MNSLYIKSPVVCPHVTLCKSAGDWYASLQGDGRAEQHYRACKAAASHHWPICARPSGARAGFGHQGSGPLTFSQELLQEQLHLKWIYPYRVFAFRKKQIKMFVNAKVTCHWIVVCFYFRSLWHVFIQILTLFVKAVVEDAKHPDLNSLWISSTW